MLLGISLLLPITAFLPTAAWVQQSMLAPYFLRAAHAVSFLMPTDLRLKLLDGLEHIRHNTPDWVDTDTSGSKTQPDTTLTKFSSQIFFTLSLFLVLLALSLFVRKPRI